MSWEHFILFAIAALICWGLGAFTAWKGKKPAWTYGFTLLGLAIFFSFILGTTKCPFPPFFNTKKRGYKNQIHFWQHDMQYCTSAILL